MPINHIPEKSISLYKMDFKKNLESYIYCTGKFLAIEASLIEKESGRWARCL